MPALLGFVLAGAASRVREKTSSPCQGHPGPAIEEFEESIACQYVRTIVRSERGCAMSTINVTTARSTLYRLIDQVAEESRPIRITGQRSTAVLVSEEDWEAIQETLYLQAVPGMVDSIRQAREESVEAASEELDW